MDKEFFEQKTKIGKEIQKIENKKNAVMPNAINSGTEKDEKVFKSINAIDEAKINTFKNTYSITAGPGDKKE